MFRFLTSVLGFRSKAKAKKPLATKPRRRLQPTFDDLEARAVPAASLLSDINVGRPARPRQTWSTSISGRRARAPSFSLPTTASMVPSFGKPSHQVSPRWSRTSIPAPPARPPSI